jgi:uncharacterized protein (TIGR02117 family)
VAARGRVVLGGRQAPALSAVRVLAALVVAVAGLGGGCAAAVPELFPPALGEQTKPVWLVQHGWHTRVVVRRADVDPAVWPESGEQAGGAYLEVGWGDAAFYPADEPGVAMALNAVLRPTPAVLHVGTFDQPPPVSFAGQRVVRVDLSTRGFERLTGFVHGSYTRDGQGRPVETGPGRYPRSRFYQATGRYHLFNTSNTWTARALREAGAPVTPVWAITAGGVMRQAARVGRALP